jgi:glutathione S-transferase
VALPGQLDRVDALLAEGVIGGERPNAADFQIAPSVRLMLTFDQLREHVDGRPAGAHARRLVPDFPGRIRDVFPAQWLPF